MQQLIARLIERGHAYAAPDGSGDVYFDTGSWPSYGELTRQSRDNMEAAADADPRGKRDPRDFALWKGRKPDEPESAAWPSPWGAGRPGWHIECSAMATRYLGEEFDIHGGGLDLRFPHHENELAQSTAAGHAFARYWVHNGLVNVGGQKMSKSLGNSVYAERAPRARLAARRALPAGRRALPLDARLRADARSLEAEAAVDRIRSLPRSASSAGSPARATPASAARSIPDAFAAAMDDDLGVPQALAVLHDTVRAGNQALDAEELHDAAALHGQVVAMVEVLGIDPRDPHWAPRRRARGIRARQPSSPASSKTGRPPARPRTSPRPTGSAPSSRPRASPSKTARPARIGAWDHEGQQQAARRSRAQGRRASRSAPAARAARRSRARARRPRPRTAPGTPPASARPPRSGTAPRAARAGRPGRSPGRASAPAPRAGHPVPRVGRSRATSPRS